MSTVASALKRLAAPLMAKPSFALAVRLLRKHLTYNHMGLATVVSADFMKDPRFKRAYEMAVATGSWKGADPVWNCYLVCWAAAMAAKLPGDFVECGVYRGALSHAVVEYVGFAKLNKRFFLVDTFEGGVPEQRNEAERTLLGSRYVRGGGYYDECYDSVLRSFAAFPNVVLVKGSIPDCLPAIQTDAVSFLSIDMNCREPEIAAIEHFWDRLVPGGIVVLDDYGWLAHDQQKRGFDEFARHRGTEVLSLPTGQGLLIKA